MTHATFAEWKGDPVRFIVYGYKYKKTIEDDVRMAVPNSTQTRFNFVGISIMSYTSGSVCKASLHFDIDSMHVGYPWVVSVDCLYIPACACPIYIL